MRSAERVVNGRLLIVDLDESGSIWYPIDAAGKHIFGDPPCPEPRSAEELEIEEVEFNTQCDDLEDYEDVVGEYDHNPEFFPWELDED